MSQWMIERRRTDLLLQGPEFMKTVGSESSNSDVTVMCYNGELIHFTTAVRVVEGRRWIHKKLSHLNLLLCFLSNYDS